MVSYYLNINALKVKVKIRPPYVSDVLRLIKYSTNRKSLGTTVLKTFIMNELN